jgi:hypothetical protein
MIAFLSPLADDGISYNFGFVFCGVNVAAALFIWFFLYETRMLSLENVDLMYQQPDLKAWTSNRWVPPGYSSRENRDFSAKDAIGRRFSDDTLRIGSNEAKNGNKPVGMVDERQETV